MGSSCSNHRCDDKTAIAAKKRSEVSCGKFPGADVRVAASSVENSEGVAALKIFMGLAADMRRSIGLRISRLRCFRHGEFRARGIVRWPEAAIMAPEHKVACAKRTDGRSD